MSGSVTKMTRSGRFSLYFYYKILVLRKHNKKKPKKLGQTGKRLVSPHRTRWPFPFLDALSRDKLQSVGPRSFLSHIFFFFRKNLSHILRSGRIRYFSKTYFSIQNSICWHKTQQLSPSIVLLTQNIKDPKIQNLQSILRSCDAGRAKEVAPQWLGWCLLLDAGAAFRFGDFRLQCRFGCEVGAAGSLRRLARQW